MDLPRYVIDSATVIWSSQTGGIEWDVHQPFNFLENGMSWSVSAVGRPAAVAAKLAKDIASIKCMEPEETIKNGVGTIIAAALAAYPESYAVTVSANGSQGPGYDPNKSGATVGQVNSLTVSISPLYGFVS